MKNITNISYMDWNPNTSQTPEIIPYITSTSFTEIVTNLSMKLVQDLDFSQVLYQPDCSIGWVPLGHIYFQLASLLLLLSLLAPHSLTGILIMRSTMVFSFSLFGMWGMTVACALDITVWNTLCVIINLTWVFAAIWKIRPVILNKEMENVYDKLFKTLRVTRRQFKTLLSATKERRSLSTKEFMIEEKISRVDCLSLVLKGRLLVSQCGKSLHVVSENQFIDSPEWFGVTTDDFFQVSVIALEECEILTWHRDKLKFHLMDDPFLQAILDHILGRDVVNKLMQAQNKTNEETNTSALKETLDKKIEEDDQEEEHEESDEDGAPILGGQECLMTSLLKDLTNLTGLRLGKISESHEDYESVV